MVIEGGATLARRLDRYRAATRGILAPAPPSVLAGDLAARLATALDGEVVRTVEGVIVRCEAPSRPLPVDRDRLAGLPSQPAAGVPLVCLDTETTGLATAAGTVAFLIGLGWWEADRFRQVQLLLPDHGEERALLTALEAALPPAAWLVTYNGRTFDWPLLVARYRMVRRAPPAHGGHLDLLPMVRRLFRHRMPDARLRTAEAELLGLRRIGDVEGWEIPGRYLGFLQGGPASPLAEVVRHNDQDVRSLAWLLAHLAERLGDPEARAVAPAGDLAGLARSFAREHRLAEALACLEAAAEQAVAAPAADSTPPAGTMSGAATDDEPWWSPHRPPDFGGRQLRPAIPIEVRRAEQLDVPWTSERIAIDRAHLLRRIGRYPDAAAAWSALAAGPGPTAIIAAIELAKLHEHRLRDPAAALDVTHTAMAKVERRRALGRPDPRTEADLVRRAARLRRRIAIAGARSRRTAPRSPDQSPAMTSGTRGSADSVAQRSLT